MHRLAFQTSTSIRIHRATTRRNHTPRSERVSRIHTHIRQSRACVQPPTDTPTPPNVLSDDIPTPLLSPANLMTALEGTMLQDEKLAQVYSATQDGFSNDAFFEKLIPLGGVPSLVLGRTEAGVLFGGYSAYGFYARDDYRQASTSRSLFVFTVDDGNIVFADNTDPVHYDFYDYAIRFGAALLGVPMNPAKHVLKANMATSSCRLPNGQTSVFGDATLAKIGVLQVWVAEKYVDKQQQKEKDSLGSFFSRLFR